ncbi:MAG: ribosome maturation factor RimM [Herpetosiphon sp.]
MIGVITQAFGIKGQVKLASIMTHPEHLRRMKTLLVGPKLRVYRLLEMSEQKANVLVLRLENVNTRNEAEELHGQEVFIRSTDAAPLQEEEYFLHDLPGLEVYTVGGMLIGHVKEVLETGANDVLVVGRSDQSEVLIPMIRVVVRSLNITARRIEIEPMPGLLD